MQPAFPQFFLLLGNISSIDTSGRGKELIGRSPRLLGPYVKTTQTV